MKEFSELSEHITEEEYRNNGRFHFSDIAGYMKGGFSYLLRKEKEDSASLTFGSMVDCLITEGIDVFNTKYCVSKDFGVSDNQKLVINDLLETGYEGLEYIPPQLIVSSVRSRELYKNYKDESKIVSKIIEECGDYYKFLKQNIGKIPVDFEMFQDAKDTANKLLTSETVGGFFTGNNRNVDKFYQLKFNGDIDGIPVTCMVDALYIDHDLKKIWPIDLKTTCVNYEWEFPKSFIKYRYDVQAKLYSSILKQIIDSDEDYKYYELMGFIFVYVSRNNKLPLVWTFEKNLSDEDIIIELENGNKIILEDFRKYLKEMDLIRTENRTVPLDISIYTGNDILEHIKNF